MGHTVRLMSPQFVKPYVKTNKNDAADAEAICEAVARPNMRFVPIKTADQQAVLSLHRARQGFVKERTAMANRIRGLLAEYGIAIPKGIHHITATVADVLEDAENGLPGIFRELLSTLVESFRMNFDYVAAMDLAIQNWHKNSKQSQRLATIPGIGPITATALLASLGDAKSFDSGRQVSAWLGLVPRQHSSGGKPTLLGISKRGDSYLRKLLIHGARSVILSVQNKGEENWLGRILKRKNKNLSAVALANKNARIAWALLTHERDYELDYSPA